MPMPKPKPEETEEDFIARCMSDSVMESEYDDTEQRSAVCYSQWRGKAHPHGDHVCICSECGAEVTVGADVKCNTQECPECGGAMVAKEAGERRKAVRMERKSVKFEVKEINEEEGVIEGYAATFSQNPDAYGDVIEPGAFKKTLKERGGKVVSLFNHDVNMPIGKPECSEDERGLFTRIKLVRGIEKAEEVLKLAKADVINTMSIGYETVKEAMVGETRHLKELRLFDVSPVVFAANPEAVITGVKSLERMLDDVDLAMKEGRVLSSSNLAKVRAAIEALQKLLDSAEPSEDTPPKSEPHSTLDRMESVHRRLQASDLKRASDRLDEILKGAK